MDDLTRNEVEVVPELLTVREAAERFSVSEPTVWRYVRSGKLPAFRVGGTVRIRSADADRFEVPYEVRTRP
jgi:excisionase family DNA binding protein